MWWRRVRLFNDMELNIRPIRRHVLLLDDGEETVTNGVIVKTGIWRTNMDYFVLRVGTDETCDFGQGDRVLIRTPDVGRKLRLGGVPMRIVRAEDIIGVIGVTDGNLH